mgnify:CR=1 FL=1
MSGHNKWSTIKRQKNAADAKRGKLFTKLVKEISVAAREGGGDPETNPNLRMAVDKAKEANMPKENIERAIKKGTGELEGVNYEQHVYEGYGHNGVAILVETLTDNSKRTVAEVRHVFSSHDGNLAESGAVAWIFEKKGIILIKQDNADEDEVMMDALEAGAEDIVIEDDSFKIITPFDKFHNVNKALKEKYDIEDAELTRIPKNTVKADDFAEQLVSLLTDLEDLDDVQKVYSNHEFSEEVLTRLQSD